jgi:hypothetical protein
MKLKELNTHLLYSEMCQIASSNGTDKVQHGYTKVYNEIMKDKREYADIFEIGIYQGNSIRLWRDYFKSGIVCGVDNGRLLPYSKVNVGFSNENPSEDEIKLLSGETSEVDFSWIENDRVKCFIADQRSESDLEKSFNHFGVNNFDFIIDDGHHYQEHQQISFEILFKNVKPGGYYIIEDVAANDNLKKGHFWGQKNSDLSDTTDSVFNNFMNTGKLESPYFNKDRIVLSDIEDIFIYDNNGLNNSPINGSSKLIVIKKR